MEEGNEGCHKDKECFGTSSVMARLSAVSLMDAPHSHPEQQNSYSLSPCFPSTLHENTLSAMANSTQSTRMCASQPTCIDVSDVTSVDVSHAMRVDVSHAACVDVPHAAHQEAVSKQGNGPCWAEMVPDALVKIFNFLPLQHKLCNIACVCRSWQFVSQSAACWQSVDLSEWSYDKHPKTLERMILLVVNRSRGSLQQLCAPNLKNDTMLRLIADNGSQLRVLRIPDSFVSEECICELAPKFASLAYLDISGRFPSKALIESFGTHCPFITGLKLNMRLHENFQSCDSAALSVAQYMPQLKHLELAYGSLSNVGLDAILENCTSLEHLDLRGCWHVHMDEVTILNARQRIKVFLSPVVENDIYEISDEDDVSDEDDDAVDYDEYIDDNLEGYDFEFFDEFEYLNNDVEFLDDFDTDNMEADVNSWDIDMHEDEM